MIKFSVLTSIYKSEKFLDNYFKTIFNQILLPDEIIIIDDTRNPKNIDEIIENIKVKYNFSNIKLYKNSENKGPAISLNIGLIKCSNDLIFRLDVDDLWEKNHTKKMLDFYLKDRSYLIYANSLIKSNFLNNLKCDQFFINENHLIHSSWLINRSVCKNFRYHMLLPAVALEDYFSILFYIRKNYKIFFTYENTCKYIFSVGSHGRKNLKNKKYLHFRKMISTYFFFHHIKNKNFYQICNFFIFKYGLLKLIVYLFWIKDLIHIRKFIRDY